MAVNHFIAATTDGEVMPFLQALSDDLLPLTLRFQIFSKHSGATQTRGGSCFRRFFVFLKKGRFPLPRAPRTTFRVPVNGGQLFLQNRHPAHQFDCACAACYLDFAFESERMVDGTSCPRDIFAKLIFSSRNSPSLEHGFASRA